jgi:rubrerythrin
MRKEIRDLEKVLEVFTIAERREKEAYEFYMNAAEKVTGEAERKVLLSLADYEMQHLKMMQINYEKTLKKIQELQQKK